MSANSSLGTYFSDGLRTGPQFVNQFSTTSNGQITGSNYSAYGPAVLLSNQNTYNITPAPPNPAGGFTNNNNLVAPVTSIEVPAATYLTLRGDNAVTYYTTGPNGFPLIQLDWPRVIRVSITGNPATVNTHVTIFGYDYYGVQLQQTYILGAVGNYPTIVDGVGATPSAITLPDAITPLPTKAFYQVTKAYIDTALPVGCTLSLGAVPIFGLPYVVNGTGVITNLQWGTQAGAGLPNTNAIIPTSELTVRAIGGKLTTLGAFVPADQTNPATAITGDVRGLYATSTDPSAQTINGVNVDYKNLIFTAYIAGEDNFINQVAADQLQYMLQTGSLTPQGVPIAPLVVSDAYGVPQFYTGVPS